LAAQFTRLFVATFQRHPEDNLEGWSNGGLNEAEDQGGECEEDRGRIGSARDS